jgi:hypothetical protein
MSVSEELGLESVINASGSVTRLGGAPMPEAVLEAFCAAADRAPPIQPAARTGLISTRTRTDGSKNHPSAQLDLKGREARKCPAHELPTKFPGVTSRLSSNLTRGKALKYEEPSFAWAVC